MPREGWNELQEAAWSGNLQKVTQIVSSYVRKSDPPVQTVKQSLQDAKLVRNNSGSVNSGYIDGQAYQVQDHSHLYSATLSGSNNSNLSNSNSSFSNQQILNELTSSTSSTDSTSNTIGYLDGGGETLYSVSDKSVHHEDQQENLRVLINTQTPNAQETALHLVCHNKYCNTATGVKIIDILLLHGADIEIRNSFGQTPLFVAAQQGQLEFVQHLVTKGANIETTEKEQATPLYIACERGYLPIVKYLVQKGARLDTQELNGATALFIAAQKGHVEIVADLLKCGADPNVQANDGTTALHVSVEKVAKETIKELLKNPLINTNLTTKRTGKTPLHISALRGSEEVSRWLLQKGSNPNAVTKDGKKPFELATRPAVQKLLSDAAMGIMPPPPSPQSPVPSHPQASPPPVKSTAPQQSFQLFTPTSQQPAQPTSPALKATSSPASPQQTFQLFTPTPPSQPAVQPTPTTNTGYNFTPSSSGPQSFQLFTPTTQPPAQAARKDAEETLNSGYVDSDVDYHAVPGSLPPVKMDAVNSNTVIKYNLTS